MVHREEPRHDPVDHPPLGHEPRPHQQRGDPVLHDHRLEPTGPHRHPQGQRGRERARNEQPLRVVPLIAASIVSSEEERDEQRRRILPAVHDGVRQDAADLGRETIAQPGVVAYRAYHFAHDVERREVGDEQYGEPPHRAQHVIVQVGNGALLQAETNPERCLELNGRGELDRTVRRVEMQPRRCRGRSARRPLCPHLAWRSLHSRSTLRKRPNRTDRVARTRSEMTHRRRCVTWGLLPQCRAPIRQKPHLPLMWKTGRLLVGL